MASNPPNPFGLPLRKTQRFYGNTVKEQVTGRAGNFFVDDFDDSPPTCVHGHLMRTMQEIGGHCYCGAWLCVECAKLRCNVCADMACRDHAEVDGERVICRQHGFWQRLVFFLK